MFIIPFRYFYNLMQLISEPIDIRDPLNPMNNTARNAFRISDILQLF